jgi:RNA polymerase sigma-70 factor (ECF subfamily)
MKAKPTDCSAKEPTTRAVFTQTSWTNIREARGSSVEAQAALNQFCRNYWPPVYAFIRRKWTQHSAHKAQDLTQGFFVEFVRKFPDLEIDPSKGKFRTYLLACLTRFLCKDWERSPSAHETVIPPEEFERVATVDGVGPINCAPEHAFDIVWANTLAEKALEALRNDYEEVGKADLHARLLPLLTGRAEDGAYAAMATELDMSEGALRVATHQFRRRFGQLLRTEVTQTVSRPEDTDDELRYLLSLWGSPQIPQPDPG